MERQELHKEVEVMTVEPLEEAGMRREIRKYGYGLAVLLLRRLDSGFPSQRPGSSLVVLVVCKVTRARFSPVTSVSQIAS